LSEKNIEKSVRINQNTLETIENLFISTIGIRISCLFAGVFCILRKISTNFPLKKIVIGECTSQLSNLVEREEKRRITKLNCEFCSL
jgi:hypothetical protein